MARVLSSPLPVPALAPVRAGLSWRLQVRASWKTPIRLDRADLRVPAPAQRQYLA